MRKITQARIQRVEFARTAFQVRPEEGTTLADILDPAYWAHVSAREGMRYGDRIEVLPADRSFFAELLVLDAGPQWARVEVLSKREFKAPEAAPIAAPDGYEVKHRGRAGWSVIRTADKALLHEGAATRDGAHRWLADHLRKLAA